MPRPPRSLLLFCLAGALATGGLLGIAGCASRAEGVSGGHLAPCDGAPNGVSSRSSDARHRIEALRYAGTPDEGRRRLLEALRSVPRVGVVEQEGDYIHATAQSLVFRFTDDLEFLLAAPGEIEARSRARAGYYDFGVNRRRLERIRELVATAGPASAP